MLKLDSISKHYKKNEIFSNISLTIPDNCMILLKGENGSGKTTLLNLLSLSDKNYDGTIFFDGLDTKKLNHFKTQNFRRKYITYISQKHNLLTFLSDKENEHLNENTYNKKETRGNKVSSCSEGEQMKCALNRAIKDGKKLYIFDEVFSSLDQENQKYYFEKIKELKKNAIVIIVSHFTSTTNDFDYVIELKNQTLRIEKKSNSQMTNLNDFVSPQNAYSKKHNFKFFWSSFKNNKLLKFIFLFLSVISLTFSVGGTGLLFITPSIAFTSELINSNALVISTEQKNSKIIIDKFEDDIEYISPSLNIFQNEIKYFNMVSNILIDPTIKDNKIHLNNDYLNYLIDNFSHINSISDILVGRFSEKVDYEIVIDNNIKKKNFYIGETKETKTAFYVRLNDSNRKQIFQLIDWHFIKFETPMNYALINYEKNSETDLEITSNIKIIDQIVDDHNNPSVKLRLETLIIFLFISFTGILLMLLTSIRRSESKNIKILEREGYQRYEINFIIYGPYLIMLLVGLIIGKVFSFYLYPSKDVFGFIAYFIPENFMFYLFYFTIIWGISYFYSRRKLKWEI